MTLRAFFGSDGVDALDTVTLPSLRVFNGRLLSVEVDVAGVVDGPVVDAASAAAAVFPDFASRAVIVTA